MSEKFLDKLFAKRLMNRERLIQEGFLAHDGVYVKAVMILEDSFQMTMTVDDEGRVDFTVVEMASGEPYDLVKVPQAKGSFVTEVRKACEVALGEIAERCFEMPYQQGQRSWLISHFEQCYGAVPAFPWEKYPSYAVFRRHDNDKWFAILMTISVRKLGLDGNEEVTILNVKGKPETIEGIIDEKQFFKAYHMNKKHWFSVLLDAGVEEEVLANLVARSYQLTGKR